MSIFGLNGEVNESFSKRTTSNKEKNLKNITLDNVCDNSINQDIAKGQIKSKMIFSSRHFFQKMNEQIRLYYSDTSGQLVFIHFN